MDAPTVAVNHREMAVNGGGKKASKFIPRVGFIQAQDTDGCRRIRQSSACQEHTFVGRISVVLRTANRVAAQDLGDGFAREWYVILCSISI